jgi:hypothetical protein
MGAAGGAGEAAVPLSPRERAEIEDAKAFLARIGYPITAPIVVAETLGPDVFGMAKNETIYLARVTINRGGNFLIGHAPRRAPAHHAGLPRREPPVPGLPDRPGGPQGLAHGKQPRATGETSTSTSSRPTPMNDELKAAVERLQSLVNGLRDHRFNHLPLVSPKNYPDLAADLSLVLSALSAQPQERLSNPPAGGEGVKGDRNTTLDEVIGRLASGARVILDSEGYPHLHEPQPHIDGPLWDRLCREGWLEPMANGGTFKLSEAGFLAYLRSTDELRTGPLSLTQEKAVSNSSGSVGSTPHVEDGGA